MTKTFILLIVCMASALAQPIGFGLKVGAPFTQAFNTGASGSTSYTSDTSDTSSVPRWNSDYLPAWESNSTRCIRS